ncbi:hypothetical protein RclHR1_08280005 [Rhizophagus clarus]|uniref:Uncharacterized protein n=1 Tax=Rhizophagus clarus TaxID=94130 RepID=A0A2Z6SMT7_9GLOM|nr:hypothetical protein RclHR1_08280005 [Rhizophagus clarus]GES79989.1 hypothetical protein GLOIN_2v1885154 [Rhizophagus clarus]
MPRADKKKSWSNPELIKVLGHINNNFNKWHDNHQKVCNEAAKAAKTNRNAKSVYNKVYKLIKDMENSHQISGSDKVRKLVREIYRKTEEKTNEGKQEITKDLQSDDDIINILNTDQVTIETIEALNSQMDMLFSIEMANKFCDEKIQNINHTAEKTKEMVKDRCNRQIERFHQRRSELLKSIEDQNKLFEELGRFTIGP